MITRINDFQTSIECVANLLRKYSYKDLGDIPKWKTQNSREQLKHVRDHLDNITLSQREVPLVNPSFEDFVSLACRSLMVLEHVIKEQEENYLKWVETARTSDLKEDAE